MSDFNLHIQHAVSNICNAQSKIAEGITDEGTSLIQLNAAKRDLDREITNESE